MNPAFRTKYIIPDAVGAFGFKMPRFEDIKDSCLFVLDTNVLVLPYTISKEGVDSVASVYQDLKGKDRLFVPAQVAREFIGVRAKKITELYHNLSQKRDQNFSWIDNYPLLVNMPQYKELLEIESKAKEAIKAYRNGIDNILSGIKELNWNDHITSVYQDIFIDLILDDNEIDFKELEKDFNDRNKLKIAPGYKDANKDDNNAGDLIIWKEICALGKKSKNLLFL